MEKRKTAQDYKKEYRDLQKKQLSLDAHVTSRLVDLSKKFPDAIIAKRADDFIKAMCLTPNYIGTLDIETRIQYIEAIEDWNRKLEGVHQLVIEE